MKAVFLLVWLSTFVYIGAMENTNPSNKDWFAEFKLKLSSTDKQVTHCFKGKVNNKLVDNRNVGISNSEREISIVVRRKENKFPSEVTITKKVGLHECYALGLLRLLYKKNTHFFIADNKEVIFFNNLKNNQSGENLREAMQRINAEIQRAVDPSAMVKPIKFITLIPLTLPSSLEKESKKSSRCSLS